MGSDLDCITRVQLSKGLDLNLVTCTSTSIYFSHQIGPINTTS